MDILLCQTCGWILQNPVDDCPNCGSCRTMGGRAAVGPAWSETKRNKNWQQDSLDYLPLGMQSSVDNILISDKPVDSPHFMLLGEEGGGDFFERGPEALRGQRQGIGKSIVIPNQDTNLQPPQEREEKAGLPETKEHANESVSMLTALLKVQEQSRKLVGTPKEEKPVSREPKARKTEPPVKRRSFSGTQTTEDTPIQTLPPAGQRREPREPMVRRERRADQPPRRAPSLPRLEMPDTDQSRPIVIAVAACLIVVGTLMLFAAWMGVNSQAPPAAVNAPEIAGLYEVRMRAQGEARDHVWRMRVKQSDARLEASGRNNDGTFQMKGKILSQNALAFTLVSLGDPDLAKHPSQFQGGFTVDELGRASMAGTVEMPMRQTTFARVKWLRQPGRWSAKMLVGGAAISDGD